jgi:hypothetical protein
MLKSSTRAWMTLTIAAAHLETLSRLHPGEPVRTNAGDDGSTSGDGTVEDQPGVAGSAARLSSWMRSCRHRPTRTGQA